MIESTEYLKLVKSYFSFLETELDYSLVSETVRGNAFYDIVYQSEGKQISISYENIEDNFELIVFLLENGELPDYDNKTNTLHLNALNRQIISKLNKNEVCLNAEIFLQFEAKDNFSKKLLKEAKELRLCLVHFDQR